MFDARAAEAGAVVERGPHAVGETRGMLGVFTGFGIIAVIIAAGYLIARFNVAGPSPEIALSRVAFFVATPALLFTVLARSDVQVLFSGYLLVAAISAIGTSLVFLLLSRLFFRMSAGDTIIGTSAAGYVNSNNIGLPVAIYVIGSPEFVAPVLLLQLIVLSPIILGLLDTVSSGAVSLRRILTQPVRNPMIIASALGLAVAILGIPIPEAVMEPFDIVGGAAIPMVLMVFGMSLRGRPPLVDAGSRLASIVAIGLKSVGMPAVAFVLGEFVFALPPDQVLAATVMAALPTAQNIHQFAMRYERGTAIARDVVLLSTLVSMPVILVVVVVLGVLHPGV